MNNLDTRVLLIVEASIEIIAEHQYIYALSLKILTLIKLQILWLTANRHRNKE